MHIRNEYPRPQLRRERWFTLNGEWEFDFDDADNLSARSLSDGKTKLNKKINVPFTYQFKESGIGDVSYHKTMWYRRKFSLTQEQLKERALLCFNGCDYIADVWINGQHVITHRGAYAAFKCDVTNAVSAENVIVVRCVDPLDPTIPRGKQSWTNEKFGCWYVPNSGIWQSVWMEFFGDDCLDEYSLIPDVDACAFSGEITTLKGIADAAKITVYYNGKQIKQQSFTLDGKHSRYSVSLMEQDYVDESMFWTMDRPNLLYVDFELTAGGKTVDVAHTRFGMRKISVNEDGFICLNNTPVYQRLILDQGFWEKSGITPPSAEDIRKDIELSIAMGFNGARKHQKIEDPYFYYYAEELGFLTWCEMPSAYNFNACEQQYVMSEWQEIVKANRNFTSVVCYVPLNESWGVRKILNDDCQQNFARSLYYATKALDPSRLISTNDGWENVDPTDIVSIHDYAINSDSFAEKYTVESLNSVYPQHRKLFSEGMYYSGQPVIMSEFGGIALQSGIEGENWGYNSAAKNKTEFYDRYGNLVDGIVKMWFQGFCYTQLTDVQQEVNGLLDANHEPKFDVVKIKELTNK